MRRLVLMAVLLYIVNVSAKRGTFPKELERCHKNDPNLDECLKNAIQNAIPFLAKGFPEAGLLPLDPLHTPLVNMDQKFGPVTLNVKFTDLYTRGYANQSVVRKIRANVAEHYIRISGIFPQLVLSGNYDMKANFFVLPIEGKGTFSLTMENVEADLEIKGEGQLREGDEYMKLKKLPLLNFQPSKLIFDLRNLFNGDERLGQQANGFLTRYGLQIFDAVRPLLQEALGKVIKETAEPFYNTVPYEEIYL